MPKGLLGERKGGLIRFVGYGIMGGGGLLFASQILPYALGWCGVAFSWLETGELSSNEVVWRSHSLYDTFAHEEIWPWLANPQEWLGLHEIISYIFENVGWSAAIIVVGTLVAMYGAELEGNDTWPDKRWFYFREP